MKLYLALIKDKEIGRLEFDWMPMVAALEFVRGVIRSELGQNWAGSIIIDNEPIFSGADDFMFFGESHPQTDGGMDIIGKTLNWKYPPGERIK